MPTNTIVIKKTKKESPPKKAINIVRAMVKFSLDLQGLTLQGLAKKYGVRRESIDQAFYRPCPKAEKTIATVIGKKPWEIWPERYDQNGKPNRRNRWYDRGSRSSELKSNTELAPSVNGKDRQENNHEKSDQSQPNVSL